MRGTQPPWSWTFVSMSTKYLLTPPGGRRGITPAHLCGVFAVHRKVSYGLIRGERDYHQASMVVVRHHVSIKSFGTWSQVSEKQQKKQKAMSAARGGVIT